MAIMLGLLYVRWRFEPGFRLLSGDNMMLTNSGTMTLFVNAFRIINNNFFQECLD